MIILIEFGFDTWRPSVDFHVKGPCRAMFLEIPFIAVMVANQAAKERIISTTW